MPPGRSSSLTKTKSSCRALDRTSVSPAAIVVGSWPAHAAGKVDNGTRSRSAIRSRLISRTVASARYGDVALGLVRLYLEEELLGRHKERILLQHTADDHGPVRPQHIHDDTRAELRQIIGADERTAKLAQLRVRPRFIFDQVLDARFLEQ